MNEVRQKRMTAGHMEGSTVGGRREMDTTSYIAVNFGMVLIGYAAGFMVACLIFPGNAKVIWKFLKDFVARLRGGH